MIGRFLKMKLGIIGAGSIVPFHLDALITVGFVPDCIAARAKSQRARDLAKLYNIPEVLSSAREVIEKDLDALLIAPASDALEELVPIIVKRRLPTLIEKPVFLNKFDMNVNASRKDAHVMVGYNRRFYDSVQKLKNYIDVHTSGFFRFTVPELSSNHNPTFEDVTNTIRNNTVHALDLVEFLFKPRNFAITDLGTGSSSIFGPLLIDYSSEHFVGSVTVTFGSPANYKLEVFQPGAYLSLSPLETYAKFDQMAVLEPTPETPLRRYVPISSSPTEVSQHDIKFKPGFLLQAHALKKLVEHQKDVNAASLSEALRAAQLANELVETLRASLKSLPQK